MSAKTRRLAIYVFYDRDGIVGDYVIFMLAALKEHVEKIVVVCNGAPNDAGRRALESVADVVHVRENVGLDVWAYRTGLIEVVGWNNLAVYDEVLLMNYTVYGPLFPLSEMFSKMEKEDVDFWGVTAFKGPVPNGFTGKGEIPFHIQSHFIAVRRKMFCSKAFHEYWEQIPPIKDYVDSILTHESRFTEHFSGAGFRHSLYCDPGKYKVVHPAFDALDVLVEDRCPFLKRRPFFHEPTYLSDQNVELARAVDLVRETSDYDLDLIWRDITRFAKPRDLYTNATLLEIPCDEGEPVGLRADMKIAVLAHVFYPELLDEILAHARNIPVKFELFITTPDAKRKAEIERTLAGRRETGFRLAEVRVVENRGRDVGAIVIGLRDVVLTGGYDYICRLHSKMTPQNSWGMARHFKEHLFENLLLNRSYVSHLLSIFEREPRCGMILPPIIHIGYPTLGASWFTNRPGAEELAKKLGLKVPFDDYTPLAAYGTMYWFRPDALRPMFEHAFSWSDFPAEPGHKDGGLAHVIERLLVYTAHHRGYYAKCVLTPKNAAKNYVKLEYRLQKMIGDINCAQHPSTPVPFPKPQLERYVAQHLEGVPVVFGVTRASFRATRSLYRLAKKLVADK